MRGGAGGIGLNYNIADGSTPVGYAGGGGGGGADTAPPSESVPYGGGVGHQVCTEGEFAQALEVAWNDTSQPHMIQAKLLENDASETLKKLAERMGEHVG